MPQDFEKIARDAERQYREELDRVSQELSQYDFHDTPASDFEKLQAIERARNQAPLDIAAILKEIRDTQVAEQQARINAEKQAKLDNQRQALENRIWQGVGITIGLLTLAATVLFGILALLR